MANALWPEVATEDDAHKACKTAAYCAFFVGGLTAVFALVSLAGVEFLNALGIDIWSLVDAILFLGLGYGTLRHSRVAAVLLVTIYALERIIGMILAAAAGASPTSGLIMTILFTLAFIGGARGAFAMARFRAQSA